MSVSSGKVKAKAQVHPPRLYLYFNEVAKQGSIRKAAERLNVASSALNRAILALEDQVGTPLFERLSRGVRLTSPGEVFYEHVQDVLQKLDATCLAIDDLGGLVRGVVRVVATETIAIDALPHAIALFREEHSGVSFELTISSGDLAVGALLSDQADLIVSFNPRIVPGMEIHSSVKHQTCAVVRSTHPLAGRKSVSLAECAAYPLGIPRVGMGGRTILDDLFSRLSVNNVTPALVANSMEALKGFVRHSDGIAFQLAIGVSRDEKLKELKAIPLSDAADSMIVVASRKGRVLSHAAAAFLELLKSALPPKQ